MLWSVVAMHACGSEYDCCAFIGQQAKAAKLAAEGGGGK